MKNIPTGYCGKILWINLSSKEIKEEELEDTVYREYLGGYGLGVYIIYSRLKPKSPSLGKNNILGFCPGLLNSTVTPFSGRYMVCGKSPLTGRHTNTNPITIAGGWGDANSGGRFGPAIKRAGFDGIFITGKSKSPCYITIISEKIQILSASKLWGKSTLKTEDFLRNKHGKGSEIASIGKAGENLSKIAGIVTDHGRVAARSGLGAVMGSKNLKAICISCVGQVEINDIEHLKSLRKEYIEKLREKYSSPSTDLLARNAPQIAFFMRWLKQPAKSDIYLHSKTLHKWGTSYATGISSELGDLPVKNFAGVGHKDWPQKKAEKFSGQYLLRYKKKSYGCFACPLQCGAILEVPEAGLDDTKRPEYETLGAFGGLILNDDVIKAIEINHLLNEAGMDTISAGNVIAVVLECVEQGILRKEDFKTKNEPEGFLPTWGDPDVLIPLLNMMINREGIGDKLADGVRIASLKIPGSQEYAFHFSGQEVPMHDPRHTKSLMLTYVADPTPGRHTAACLDYTKLGEIDKFIKGYQFQNSDILFEKGKHHGEFAKFRQSFNALGLCEFSMWMGEFPLIESIQAVTGWKITFKELIEIGWRIHTLRQQFNVREGALEFNLEKTRIYGKPPLKNGPLKGVSVEIREMLDGYFENLGWDEDGKPTPSTLKFLNIKQ